MVGRWIYCRQIVYDGNFSAELYKPKRPDDDIALADGLGYLVAEKRYHEHLKEAIEIKQVSICG